MDTPAGGRVAEPSAAMNVSRLKQTLVLIGAIWLPGAIGGVRPLATWAALGLHLLGSLALLDMRAAMASGGGAAGACGPDVHDLLPQGVVGLPHRDILPGLVVAFAMIPQTIAFSGIAGVDPRVGLFGAFLLSVTLAVVGGRTAMITSAPGPQGNMAWPAGAQPPDCRRESALAQGLGEGLEQRPGLFGQDRWTGHTHGIGSTSFINSG